MAAIEGSSPVAMTMMAWALKWKIPAQALEEFMRSAVFMPEQRPATDESEARVQSEIRLAAARTRRYLFRNNVGAGTLKNGSFVRWGLGNDSSAVNERFKSGDLIGWESVLVTPEMTGQVIARFLSVECKNRRWKFSGTKEEMAQVAWAQLINAQGGHAYMTSRSDIFDVAVSA